MLILFHNGLILRDGFFFFPVSRCRFAEKLSEKYFSILAEQDEDDLMK